MKRLATGVPGLDTVLGGGLEPGSVTVLAGAPGTGKTVLAQQMCFGNATTERRAVYYSTMSEPHSRLVRHLVQFDFFDPQALGPRVEYLHLGDLLRQPGPDPLKPLVTEVLRKTMDEQPSLVVIDSAKALQDFTDPRQLRMAFYDLVSRLAHCDAALLLVGEYTSEEIAAGVEFALADSIIELAYQPREPIDRRWLRVVKMRGSHHLEGKHTFRISPNGFEVFPRIETLDARPAVQVSGRINSGIPGLDELMGGGIGGGDATLLPGPSGIGKTVFGLRFVVEGLAQDERCLYVTFQDTCEQLTMMAAGFGWNLENARAERRLAIQHVPLENLDLDMLSARIRRELAQGSIRRVVIDGLAELVSASREADRFPAYVRSLAAIVRAAGASLVVTSETTTLGPPPETVEGMMFLFDNVVLLRYIELNSNTGRALNIVKMRNSDHTKKVHQFTIDRHGVTLGDAMEEVTGILGWSSLRAR